MNNQNEHDGSININTCDKIDDSAMAFSDLEVRLQNRWTLIRTSDSFATKMYTHKINNEMLGDRYE